MSSTAKSNGSTMFNSKLKIEDWQPPSVSAVSIVHPKRWSPDARLLGLVGTVVLHATVFQWLLGLRAQAIRPPQALAAQATRPDVVSLSLLDIPASTHPLSAALTLQDRPMTRMSPESLPPLDFVPLAIDEPDSEILAGHKEGAELARLSGIYSGQIQARIDRIWQRPRTPIDNGPTLSAGDTDRAFQCQVQIVQDSLGNVQEVLLPNCRGSAAWKRSLISAIQQAAPLPAPPDIAVFSRTVALTFIGFAYVAGQSEEGYEPTTMTMSQAKVQ
jgi:hypothetical protein